MLVLAFLSAWRLLYLRLESAGEDPAIAEQVTFWGAFGGIIGARLFYVASYFDEFLSDPLRMLFGGAGFVFYGGLICGVLSVVYLLRKKKRNVAIYADFIAPSLSLGYAIGRLGCQLSGDGDYGKESTLPWAMSYVLGVIPTEAGVRVHPTPVYETLVALGITLILVKIRNKGGFLVPGSLFSLYLIFSSFSRFFIEYLRIEPIVFCGLTQAQGVSILLFIIGAGIFIRSMLLGRNSSQAQTS